jgi:hypothetical protein
VRVLEEALKNFRESGILVIHDLMGFGSVKNFKRGMRRRKRPKQGHEAFDGMAAGDDAHGAPDYFVKGASHWIGPEEGDFQSGSSEEGAENPMMGPKSRIPEVELAVSGLIWHF